jgi:GNAT superfamily N-acetyltransferase
MNIQELRKQYPQYNDLSDQDLATGFHKKFYSDLPFEDFAGRIGLGVAPAAPTAPAPKVEEAPVAPATPEEVAPSPATSENSITDFLGRVVKNVPESMNIGAAGAFRALSEQASDVYQKTPQGRLYQALTGTIGEKDPAALTAEFMAKQARESEARKIKPPADQGLILSGVESGLESFGQNLALLPAAMLPGGQAAVLSAFGGLTGGQAYQEAREKGLRPEQALPFAASQGVIEVATEKMPLGSLLNDINQKTGFGRMLLNQLKKEIPGEQLATILQDLNEWAVLNPEKPFSSYLADRPSAAAQTFIATVVGTGGNVIVGKAMQKGAEKFAGLQTPEERLIAGLDAKLEESAEPEAVTPEIKAAFATGFKQMYGRDATNEELDQLVKAYGERELAGGVATADAAGRIEPSLQVPDETGVGAGVTEQPTGTGAGGVEVSGVPAGGVGVGTTAEPSTLGEEGKTKPTQELTFTPVAPLPEYANLPVETIKAEGFGASAQLTRDTQREPNVWKVTGVKAKTSGKGQGTQFGQALTDWADQNNATLQLTAAADKPNKQKDLINFYERLGFEPTPESKERADMGLSYQGLVRYPKQLEAVTTPTPPSEVTPTALPRGMNDAQFLDAATKLRAGKVGAVKFQALKALRDSGLALSNNSLSPEGEALLDELAATSKPADLRPSGETIKAKPGANVRRLSKLLGPKLYGEPKEMPKVSVKEMVQNSFDAIKPMQEKGQLVKGVIDIKVDAGSRIISVLDNGTGMSPETLSTTFLTIAGTKKEGTRDSGGLGIAKMQFLFNNERIKVVTYRDGVLSVLESTGSELEEAMDDPNLAPDVRVYKGDQIPSQYLQMFPDGHGTLAEVVVPESYKDSSTGEDVAIKIPDTQFGYAVLEKSPLFADISVSFNGDTVRIGDQFPYDSYTQFADVKFDWGTARIYVQKNPQRYMYSDNLHILSNGLWQFDGKIAVGRGFDAKIVPRNFYLDVSPNKNVKPEDANYPFDLNRQRFSPTTEKGFEQLASYLNLVYGAVDLGNEAKNFGSIQYLYDDRGTIKATAPEELAPKGDAGIVKVASDISEGDVIEVKEGRLIVKGRVIPELSQDDLNNSRLNLDEFKIDQANVDAKRVMLHDNVELPDQEEIKKLKKELEDARSDWYDNKLTDTEWESKKVEIERKITNVKGSSLVEMARDKFGQRFDKFIYEIGDEFQKLRSYVADLMGYDDLRNEAIGISFDTEYRGVSIRLPFNGSYINPAVTEAEKMGDAAAGLVGTMIHELAHHKVRSHNADFPAEMQRITYRMEGQELEFGDTTISDIKRRVFKILRDNKNIFEFIRKVNTDANAKPRGKRFQDSGSYQRRNERRADSVERFGGTAAGEPGVSGGIELSPEYLAEERERARFSGQTTPGSIEDQVINRLAKPRNIAPAVADEIAKGNLKRALEVLSTRLTNPLYKELAAKLAALDLPTTISFNSARDLTRRQIDLKTHHQQKRMFNYVQLTYPDLYSKYFENYDRDDNLEKVYRGIKELRSPRYNMQPVIAEFTDVNKAFEDNIRGLEVAGAYYPAFDAITIDLDNSTNDVFLHEVLHAATEAILNADATTLTEGQRAAREELQKMYDYAVANIPLDLYGLTDIHEFVSEVFTNKSFQDRLKKMTYKPARAPFFTRLVRAIYQMVGIDNLASNAMATATQLFSAVRTRTPTAAGARFAPKGKRIQGPISTTWRSAEQVAVKLVGEIESAIKGHETWDKLRSDILAPMWDAGNTIFRRSILGFSNLRQIDDLTKTKFPQISGAIRIIEQMIADRNRTMTKAKDILAEWTRLQARYPKQSRLMGRIMLEATIRGVDPDTAQAGTLNPEMQAAWNGLKPEFKEIYRKVRDFYADSINTMISEMKKRALQLPKDERQKAIKEINDKFGRDKLVAPYFPLRRFGNYWFQVGKGNFKEFYEFETVLGRELAFRKRKRQLSNGNAQQQNLAETMRKGNGISELYNQNVSSTQVLKDVQDIVDSVGAITKPTQKEYQEVEKALTKQMGRTPTQEEVEKVFAVENTKKELKESLNQLIYILLPQQSVRKMFINRQSIQGASEDMIRVFATTAVHTAYQQSRFKYSERFINNLINAKEYIKELPNSDVYDDYIKEVEKRTPTILSNEDTSMSAVVAGKLSDATFYFMLSAPFSAMLNLLGMAAITMPYIGGRYGYAKANAVMLKNLGRYTATMPKRTISPAFKGQIMQMEFPSIVEGGNLDPLMQRAADRFIEDNDINISQTNDIMDIGGRPSELYTGRYNTVKRTIAALFHQSERLNREVTLLSVFELSYDKFLNEPKKNLRGVIQRDNAGNPIPNTPDEAFELAITEAKDIAGLSLGDFTRQMKPRYFTPPLLSVLTKFKQYSVLATYVVARNFYFTLAAPFRKAEIKEFRRQMIEDKIPQNIIDQRIAEADAQRRETYKEGRRRLAGILGMTFLLGGAEALPFFTLLIGNIVKLAANDDDDEFFDWDNWFKNYMEVELGGYVADIYKKMGMGEETARKAGRGTMEAVVRGPASVATGGSLSERVSLDPVNLWLRDPRFSTDTRENVVESVIANAGPVVGLGVNWAEAIELMEQGQYQRAFEKAAPAIVSKPAAAYRMADEGAKTKSGITLVDNFSAWELAIQAVGLQPERLAQKQKAAIEAKTYEQKVIDKRNTLMNRLWMERGNTDAYADTIENIQKFNQKYPEYAVEPKDVIDSFKRRGQNQMEAEVFGAQIQKKLRPRVSPMLEYGRE